MKNKSSFRLLLIAAVVILNIGCDQVSKKLVRSNVRYNENISVIDNHFTITKVENTGAFLSLGDNMPKLVKNIILSAIPLLVLGLMLAYSIRKKNIALPLLTGFCFVIGGGFGNIFDRIAYGSVTDFMHIKFAGLQTGVFNMADVSIMSGTFLILLYSAIKKSKEREMPDTTA